ncbi:RNA polymerase sigma factor [Brevibacillus migulae]|uniref:RNA polymerase sigma factor n=1 Tax=Brevibacillus migulae TaxID=1644114 RepID=UPI001F186890|nr:sigma factor [Brevibacillus migulae]
MEEDQEWISLVLQGDTQAYTHIINKYKNKVYALLLRMVNRPEDAKDLTQECFIRAYNYFKATARHTPFPPGFAGSRLICA